LKESLCTSGIDLLAFEYPVLTVLQCLGGFTGFPPHQPLELLFQHGLVSRLQSEPRADGLVVPDGLQSSVKYDQARAGGMQHLIQFLPFFPGMPFFEPQLIHDVSDEVGSETHDEKLQRDHTPYVKGMVGRMDGVLSFIGMGENLQHEVRRQIIQLRERHGAVQENGKQHDIVALALFQQDAAEDDVKNIQEGKRIFDTAGKMEHQGEQDQVGGNLNFPQIGIKNAPS